MKHKMRRPLRCVFSGRWYISFTRILTVYFRSSIILPEGVVDSLVNDAKEFLDTENWYIEAGIPHRRGYLLYGPPGTGKSELCATSVRVKRDIKHAFQSFDDLRPRGRAEPRDLLPIPRGPLVSILSLHHSLIIESFTKRSVDDSFLQRAASSIPKHGLLLIEDIDCAFSSRDDDDDDDTNPSHMKPMARKPATRSKVTLSGLLNVIDGVGSEEGKLFFATVSVPILCVLSIRLGHIFSALSAAYIFLRSLLSSSSTFCSSLISLTSPFTDELHRPPRRGPAPPGAHRLQSAIRARDDGTGPCALPALLPRRAVS